VILTTPEPFISVAQVQDHLRKTGGEELLEPMVGAACEMIRARIGEVAPVDCATTVSADRWAVTGTVVLEHRPVISLTTVVDARGPVVGSVLVSRDGGVVGLPGSVTGTVTVTYQAGRDPVPDNVTLAAIELAAHLWRNSQNAGQSRPGPGQPDATVLPGTAYSMPYRVRELLGLGKYQTDIPLIY